MTGPSTASGILRVLKAQASPQRKLTLDRLEAACNHLCQRGRPLTLVGIEEYIKTTAGKSEGPRAQTISNERKRHLGMHHYVEARERERAKSSLEFSKMSEDDFIQKCIESIPDLDTRVAMRDLFDRFILSQMHLRNAKHILKTIRPGVDTAVLLSGGGVVEVSAASNAESFAALKALRHCLLDAETLRNCGLHLKDGNIQRRSGIEEVLLPEKVINDFDRVIKFMEDDK